MKKMLTALVTVLSITVANAQKLSETDVPVQVKTAFTKMYPGVKTAQWDANNNQYQAHFASSTHTGSVLFDASGNWRERETAIPLSGLPEKAKMYIQAKYKIGRLVRATKITRAKNDVQYKAVLKNKNIFFTKEGTFIKEEE